MPDQSSLGAGVLQTAMRLSISLGLAITAAVYGTTSQTPKSVFNINFPYERAYLCTILFAVIGVLFVPFMRIGKQGSNLKPEQNEEMMEDRPRTGREYSHRSSGEQGNDYHDSQQQHQFGLEFGSSTLTVDTFATTGSQKSYFPRWSWEDERQWKGNRYRESNVVYEVCIKCLEERRVIVGENGAHDGGWQQLPDERRQSRRQQHQLEVESGWTQLPDERWQTKHQLEDEERDRTQPPAERSQPRRQVERAWQRFPVIPTRRDVERGDISRGGDGWL